MTWLNKLTENKKSLFVAVVSVIGIITNIPFVQEGIYNYIFPQ